MEDMGWTTQKSKKDLVKKILKESSTHLFLSHDSWDNKKSSITARNEINSKVSLSSRFLQKPKSQEYGWLKDRSMDY